MTNKNTGITGLSRSSSRTERSGDPGSSDVLINIDVLIKSPWIPAFAGMTKEKAGMTNKDTGITGLSRSSFRTERSGDPGSSGVLINGDVLIKSPWIPAFAGMTKEKAGMTGLSTSSSRTERCGDPGSSGVLIKSYVLIKSSWIPACAGMTKK